MYSKQEFEMILAYISDSTKKKYSDCLNTFNYEPIETVEDLTEHLANMLEYAQDSDSYSIKDEIALECAIVLSREMESRKKVISLEDWEIVTDELAEVLADLDAYIDPINNLEAYHIMHERVLNVQKILLKNTEWNKEES